MSEQRWAVLGTETGNGWLVVHPGDVCRVSDGRLECWDVHSRHDTWAEAMQEADRMARTVTVTLPRKAATMQWVMYNREVRFQHGDDIAYLTAPEHAEPFALALLAHARRG